MRKRWKELEKEIQVVRGEIVREPKTRGTAALAGKFNGVLGKFEELAEHEVAAGHDIFEDRYRYVGRSGAKFAKKPVLGWRVREVHQASTKEGAQWRWTHSHLAEII